MPLTTKSRLAAYRGIVPEIIGTITVSYGEPHPGGTLTVNLPNSVGLSHWRVVFRRVGVVGDPGHVIDDIQPTEDSAAYTYLETDVGVLIEPQVYAVAFSSAFPEQLFIFDSVEVTTPEPGGEIDWPADWDEGDITWEQRVFEGNVAKGRAVIQTSAPPNPAGFEATLYHAKAPLVEGAPVLSVDAFWVRTLTELSLNATQLGSSAITWDPGSGVAEGEYDGLSVGWKHTASGDKKQFAWTKMFQGDRPDIDVPTDPTDPADQTLGSVSISAISAAIDARSGDTPTSDPWIIDLPTGNYGNLNLTGKHPPRPIVLRSQDRAGLGARFTAGTLTECSNIRIHFCDITRVGLGYIGNFFQLFSCDNIELAYNRIATPEIILDGAGIGYIERAHYGLRIDQSAAGRSTNIRVHMNHFDGPMGEQIYANGVTGMEISYNVSSNTCGDFMICGNVLDVEVHHNWGSRLNWPSWDPNAKNGAGDFYHSDFCQVWSPGAPCTINYHHNCFIIAKHPRLGVTRQGILIQGQSRDMILEQNLIVTNALHGIWIENSVAGGHDFISNTVLRVIDIANNQTGTYFKAESSGGVGAPNVSWVKNVQQKASGVGWPGAFNIGTNGSDYTASLAYYTNPRAEIGGEMSSFYDMRPVNGAVTDWDSADPIGSAGLFEDVIVNGDYPKIGPAALAWKTWYDPKNQIAA